MTFISSVTTQEGIILAADSMELIQGGELKWTDFAEIIEEKGVPDDSTDPCISPKELLDKFAANAQVLKGRIRSFDGAKKLFQISSHCAILISGIANPNGIEFSQIIEMVKAAVNASDDKSFEAILNITFNTIEPIITRDPSDDQDKATVKYLFCGLDEITNQFKVFMFFFNDRYLLDEYQKPIRNEQGMPTKVKYFEKSNQTQLLNTAGWTQYIGELGTLNRADLNISLAEAFELSEKIMDLVVTIENVTHKVTGIGGKIFYAAITKKGFHWINTETDVMNILRD